MLDFKNYIENTKSKNDEWFLERELCYSIKHKFIYMKPCKTAGTTIYRSLLSKKRPSAENWRDGGFSTQYPPGVIEDVSCKKDDTVLFVDWWNNTSNKTMMEEYFKFVFVRNPFERLVSAYTHLHNINFVNAEEWSQMRDDEFPSGYKNIQKVDQSVKPELYYGLHPKTPTFNSFVKYNLLDGNGEVTNVHWLPQSYYVQPTEGVDPFINFVGRFETLKEDITKLCKELNFQRDFDDLPNIDYGNRHRQYTEYYDDESIEIVSRIYKRDLELFGYEY